MSVVSAGTVSLSQTVLRPGLICPRLANCTQPAKWADIRFISSGFDGMFRYWLELRRRLSMPTDVRYLWWEYAFRRNGWYGMPRLKWFVKATRQATSWRKRWTTWAAVRTTGQHPGDWFPTTDVTTLRLSSIQMTTRNTDHHFNFHDIDENVLKLDVSTWWSDHDSETQTHSYRLLRNHDDEGAWPLLD